MPFRNLLVPPHDFWISQRVSISSREIVGLNKLTLPASRFPGVVLFSEIYQGETPSLPVRDQRLIMCGG
jgi:hypothetical protein